MKKLPSAITKVLYDDILQESGGGLGELSHSDLSGLETGLEPTEDTEDIFKQLSDTSFELEQFFDFSTDVKVIMPASFLFFFMDAFDMYNGQQISDNV